MTISIGAECAQFGGLVARRRSNDAASTVEREGPMQISDLTWIRERRIERNGTQPQQVQRILGVIDRIYEGLKLLEKRQSILGLSNCVQDRAQPRH